MGPVHRVRGSKSYIKNDGCPQQYFHLILRHLHNEYGPFTICFHNFNIPIFLFENTSQKKCGELWMESKGGVEVYTFRPVLQPGVRVTLIQGTLKSPLSDEVVYRLEGVIGTLRLEKILKPLKVTPFF